MSEITVLTHNDLDALGCIMVLKQKFKLSKIFYTNYYDIQSLVNEIIEYTKDKKMTLVIADVSFSNSPQCIEQLCNNINKVVLIDHHMLEKNFEYPNLISIQDTSYCGAMLCYKYFKLNDPKLFKFLTLVNTYDLWQRKNKHFETAFYLNEMFFALKKNNNENIEKIADSLCNDYKMLSRLNDFTIKYKQDAQKIIDNLEQRHLIFRSNILKTTIVYSKDAFNIILKQELENGQNFVIGVAYGIIKIRINEFATISDKFKRDLREKLIGNANYGHINAFTYATGLTDNSSVIDEVKKICNYIKEYINDNC